jgi:hypothetical protein
MLSASGAQFCQRVDTRHQVSEPCPETAYEEATTRVAASSFKTLDVLIAAQIDLYDTYRHAPGRAD